VSAADGAAAPAGPLTVTLAVLTFRRPADLDAVLPLLVEQAAAQGDAYEVGVLVVDNDPAGGARTQVEAFARTTAGGGTGEITVRYAHEPVPGISAARNRALTEAGTRLLVFIDDDERPSERWLSLLLAQRERDEPAAVVGSVVSTYDVEPDAWVRAGGFFTRRRLASGTRVDVAATNNLLLDLDVVRRLGLSFDLAFGLGGGEDMLFSRQLRARGGQIVWCDEAVVTDVVPAERVSRRFVLVRAMSYGNTWSLTSVAAASAGSRPLVRARLVVQGAARVVLGAGRALLGALRRSATDQARGLKTAMRGAGMVGGALGVRHQAYRRPRASTASR